MCDSVYHVTDRIANAFSTKDVDSVSEAFRVRGTDDVAVKVFMNDGRVFHIRVHEER